MQGNSIPVFSKHDHLALRCTCGIGKQIKTERAVLCLYLIASVALYNCPFQDGHIVINEFSPFAQRFIKNPVWQNIVHEDDIIIFLAPSSIVPRLACIVNGINEIVRFHCGDVGIDVNETAS